MSRLNLKHAKSGYGYAALCAILVGSISTASKPVLVNTNPIIYAAIIYLLASLGSTPFTYRLKGLQVRKKDWPLIIAISLSGAVLAPCLFFIGLQQTTASDTAILSVAETIFTVLFALLFFREKLSSTGYLAVVLVIAGLFIVATNLQFSSFFSDLKKEGNLLIIGSMVLWALDNNLSKIVAQRIDISRVVQLKGLIGGGIMLSFGLIAMVPIGITPLEIPNILLVGTIGFGISLYLFLNSLRRIGTVSTMLIYSTSTIFGLLFASIFLQETIRWYQVWAVVLMLSGIYLVIRENHSSMAKLSN